MYIGPTTLLEDNAATINYHLEERFYGGFHDLEWDNDKKIKEVIANAKDNKNKVEDP